MDPADQLIVAQPIIVRAGALNADRPLQLTEDWTIVAHDALPSLVDGRMYLLGRILGAR